MVAVPRVVLLMTLFLQRCGAFVAPRSMALRGSPSFTRRGLGTSSTSEYTSRHASRHYASGHAATMVLAGLPSKTDRVKSRPWDEDFPTTVGKVAFASFKDKARDLMVKGAEKRGLDWTGIVQTLQVCLCLIRCRCCCPRRAPPLLLLLLLVMCQIFLLLILWCIVVLNCCCVKITRCSWGSCVLVQEVLSKITEKHSEKLFCFWSPPLRRSSIFGLLTNRSTCKGATFPRLVLSSLTTAMHV